MTGGQCVVLETLKVKLVGSSRLGLGTSVSRVSYAMKCLVRLHNLSSKLPHSVSSKKKKKKKRKCFNTCTLLVSVGQWSGRFLGIIGQDPSVCKSDRLHVDILRFSFTKLGYILWITLKWSVILLQSGASIGYFSKSTGWFVTNYRFFPIIGVGFILVWALVCFVVHIVVEHYNICLM